ncbi:hypothetical protein HU200_011909 [Digitaria exilis]|uniref:BTB domain-containing protein n=1 Tax=Digitaria exilis TaxID=1010633 RepID=A0A835FGD8_9POAL|nr:hypothetical protein HU200_011909 [Digitaria exilis]
MYYTAAAVSPATRGRRLLSTSGSDPTPSAAAMMKHACTQLREVVSSVHDLKVSGFCVTANTTAGDTAAPAAVCRCVVDGYGWEIRFHPAHYVFSHGYCPGLDLVFLGDSSSAGVTAMLSGKVTAHTGDIDFVPFDMRKTVPKAFHRTMDRSPPIFLGVGKPLPRFKICTITVECAVTVFREREPVGAIPVPASDLPRHLGELLRSNAGADVTFTVSGLSIAAHKGVLAVRSPVFKAEFFGEMKEKESRHVEVQDMDAAVFKAMLCFIYTDAVPELDQAPGAVATMALAQHLLVAADRYGLDRLKTMCERKLALGIDVGNVASTLALAEQQNCLRLKAKCIEFIAGGSQENLDAVLETEGYKHLAASSPLVLTELLKAAHRKKRSRSPDAK